MTESIADDQFESPDSTLSAGWIVAGVLALLLAVAVAVAAWLWLENRDPDDASADAGFLRDMSDHHAQAVEMALTAFERTEDAEIRQIAYDIATSQQAQIGMMSGWLEIWDLSKAREGDAMVWAGESAVDGHEMGEEEAGTMPGLLTDEAIDQLRTLEPAAMDLEFLRLMTIHHRGGIAMAEAAIDTADEDVVLDLARAIATSQTAEITTMEAMIAEREAA